VAKYRQHGYQDRDREPRQNSGEKSFGPSTPSAKRDNTFGPRPVNLLAAGLPVSRPAVSQHLKVLKDAGLVEERSEGVRRIYSLRREGLLELRAWLDSFWDDALQAFKLEAERSAKARKT